MKRKRRSKPNEALDARLTPSTWALSEAEIAAFKASSDREMRRMQANLRGSRSISPHTDDEASLEARMDRTVAQMRANLLGAPKT